MSELFDTPAPAMIAAHRLRALLGSGAPVTRADLNGAMRANGGSDADGDWTLRDSFNTLEHALALHLRSMPVTGLDDVAPAIALMARLPTIPCAARNRSTCNSSARPPISLHWRWH